MGLPAKLAQAAWKTLGFLVAVGLVIGFFTWMSANPDKFTAVASSWGNAGATVATTTGDWVTEKAGRDAATADAPATKVVWVESKAPGRWHVAQAVAAWDKGLTSVELRLGPCQDGAQCIKVSEAPELAPTDGHVTLGNTSHWFGTRVKLNGSAHVAARYLAVATVHELGHALGLGHSGDRSSVMFATVGTGSVSRPSEADFAAVNDKND